MLQFFLKLLQKVNIYIYCKIINVKEQKCTVYYNVFAWLPKSPFKILNWRMNRLISEHFAQCQIFVSCKIKLKMF